MIAAVPGDPMAGLMAQIQNGSGNAAAGGFDLLLNVLMALDAETAASSETSAPGSELIELAPGFTGENLPGQDDAETNTAADPAADIAAIPPQTTQTDAWIQMPAQSAAPTETVSPEAETIDNSVTVPANLIAIVQPKAVPAQDATPEQDATPQKTAQAAAQPVMTVLEDANQPEPETNDAGAETNPAVATAQTLIQQIFAAPLTAAPAEATQAQPAAKKPAKPAEQDANAAATVINIAPAQVAQTSAEPAAESTAQTTANIVNMKPASAPTAKKKSDAEPIVPQAAQPALVAEIATVTVQPTTATVSTPTATESEPAAAVSTKTVSAQPAAQPAEAAAPATAEPARPAAFKWNLSELIHRFDDQLRQVMADDKPVEQTAIKPQALNVAATETSTVETPVDKTATIAPETKSTKETETVAVAPQQAPLTFESKPKTEVTADNRTTVLIDQVRQASEWLAEKAEGSIRLGDHGVEANMKLYPPDMGGVRVSLNVSNDLNVQAQFIADRPETAQAIKQNMDQLQNAFARQGLSLDRVQVVVAPAAGSQSGATGQQSYQTPRRDADTMGQQQSRQFENRNSQDRRQREQA